MNENEHEQLATKIRILVHAIDVYKRQGICTFGEKIKEQKRVFTTNAEQLKACLLYTSRCV